MRVFLRNKRTRLYCAASNTWAAACTEALPFTNLQQAARFALDEKVSEAEIILRCDLLDQEVAMPLLAEYCNLRPTQSVVG